MNKQASLYNFNIPAHEYQYCHTPGTLKFTRWPCPNIPTDQAPKFSIIRTLVVEHCKIKLCPPPMLDYVLSIVLPYHAFTHSRLHSNVIKYIRSTWHTAGKRRNVRMKAENVCQVSLVHMQLNEGRLVVN